jgi:L-alanine-DL-glutamate epimerase-like enolase superfamily enzyme
MRIESVDLFYLSMPVIRDIGDGSQDALLVRVRAGGHTGWGECEASPLVSIANYCCPMSHSACKPVCDSILGQTLDSPADLPRISRLVRENGLDIAQTDHTLSGIDIALWDLLGRKLGSPVYELLGYRIAHPKQPYASQLFGDQPEQTIDKARRSRRQGYTAVKFGWGPFGRSTPQADRDQLAAAREGLGADAVLLVDAGTVWIDDIEQARLRLDALREFGATWLEEPFVGGALDAYAAIAPLALPVKLAGGEGAHNFHMARHLIDHGGIGFVQIDAGRIGGITTAKAVADYAVARGVTYVNHTFTTHLALSASLQPYAGVQQAEICEYPVEPTDLARDLALQRVPVGDDGLVRLPDGPGLGVEPDLAVVRKYLVDTEIRVGGRVLYRTPDVD